MILHVKLYINAQQTCDGIFKICFMSDVSELPETYMFPQN